MRGFTLLELMVVVSIIAISAALATPSLIRVVQDRRVQKDAIGVLGLIQDARARSFGRGGAVVITWDSAIGTEGLLKLEESMQDADGDGTDDVPNPSCTGNLQPSPRFYQLSTADRRVEISANTAAHTGAPVAQPTLQLCYTPRGRFLFRDTPADPWQQVAQVYSFRFQPKNNDGTLVPNQPLVAERWVHVAPNGIARMSL